jgi:hypothetical protein
MLDKQQNSTILKHMKNTTIQELRKNGYKVRVIHRGLMDKDDALVNTVIIANDGSPSVTQIDVTTPDGRDVTGYAYRAWGDPYNRKMGNTIALGRALKELR